MRRRCMQYVQKNHKTVAKFIPQMFEARKYWNEILYSIRKYVACTKVSSLKNYYPLNKKIKQRHAETGKNSKHSFEKIYKTTIRNTKGSLSPRKRMNVHTPRTPQARI